MFVGEVFVLPELSALICLYVSVLLVSEDAG